MAVNDLTFNQLATVLNSIVSQATGTAQITPTTTGDFVSVAQVGLKTGYDPIISAISQVLSRTIFSNRPYNAKFSGLRVTNQRYGNHVRKLNTIDKAWENDSRLTLADGYSIDQWTVNKPAILQTNFYGENVYQKSLTIFRDQLDSAFSGPEEFGQFISMIMQNASDMIEQAHESTARATVANFIGGKINSDTANVIYLLDEYNADTGANIDSQSVFAPENYVPFVKWMYGYINTLTSMMTERSAKFHKNFTISDSPVNIMRHTPYDRMKCYLFTKAMKYISSTVFSDIFGPEYLKMIDWEDVNFWQSIDDPMRIKVTPSYNDTDGTLISSAVAVNQDKILGVIFDEEAMGYTVVNQWSSPTPFNAKGGYSNIYWHFTDRYWNDFTENAIVLVLDNAPDSPLTRTLTSIAVTTPPTKTTYVNGDEFATAGMAVTATYTKGDGTTATAVVSNDDLTIAPATLTTGLTSVNIAYAENDVIAMTTQAITVNAS